MPTVADLRALIRRLDEIEQKVRRSRGTRPLGGRVLLRIVEDETDDEVLAREGLAREQVEGAHWIDIEFIDSVDGRPAVAA